jgi:hypothetical protein
MSTTEGVQPLSPDAITLQLRECASCQRPISVLAVSCPGCGAPNTWHHPGVEHFLSIKDRSGVKRPFKFTYDRLTLQGTAESISWIGALLLCIVSAIVFFMWAAGASGWTVLIGWLFGVAVVAGAGIRTAWFKVDFSTGVWESSNEAFWKPIREELRRHGHLE